jgi:hypothetical protein
VLDNDGTLAAAARLRVDAERGAPSRATTTMSRDWRPSLTAYEKEGKR